MPILHVRNVPEALYERLRRRALEQNRSIGAEVLMLLDYALEESRDTQSVVLARIRRRRFFDRGQAGAPDSTALLRQERER